MKELFARRQKKPARNRRRELASCEKTGEAPVRVELTMADLQSAALATWLRRLMEHLHP
jgi:hypothetical protein